MRIGAGITRPVSTKIGALDFDHWISREWSRRLVLVSHRKRFIFIKPPKTAGSSLESLLRRWCLTDPEAPGLDSHVFPETVSNYGIVTESGNTRPVTRGIRPHSTIAQIRQFLGNSVFEDYLKITIVRNPYDRAVSMFWWHLAQNNPSMKEALELASPRGIRRALGFWLHSESKFVRWAHLAKFTNPALLGPNSLILKYEELNDQCELLLDRLKIPHGYRRLPSYKKGIRPQSFAIRDHFNWPTSLAVLAKFHWEFQNFNYPLSIPRMATISNPPRPRDTRREP